MSPAPHRIQLGHGSGGRLTHELIRDLFARRLRNPILDPLGDAALLPEPGGRLAMTTDSFVVSPLFFPGGDIGQLAVHGTVNDLAVSGARPTYLSLAVILEEGLPMETLERVVGSLAGAAREAGVGIVTGDTKVVERGKGDGIFINTTGVGVLREGFPRSDRAPRTGDALLASGTVGDHGAVVLASRSEVELAGGLVSDCAPVTDLVEALFEAGVVPLFMRDPTRGGLAGVACDVAEQLGLGLDLEEDAIPVHPDVMTLCDLVGVDPLHLACEGRVVALCAAEEAERALSAWRALPAGRSAARIGALVADHAGRVTLATRYGGARRLVRPTAEQLPRIC
jgi:hydrogenase expression/formation protein HypE